MQIKASSTFPNADAKSGKVHKTFLELHNKTAVQHCPAIFGGGLFH